VTAQKGEVENCEYFFFNIEKLDRGNGKSMGEMVRANGLARRRR
jgi:hypothetical protein